MKKPAYLGGIVKLSANSMYGFHIGFKTSKEANEYKEMLNFILAAGGKYKIENKRAAYDTEAYR